MCRAWVWSLVLEKLFVGTKNPSGSIQNQRVDVVLAIMCQTDVCFGKGVDERLATRAIRVAVVQPYRKCAEPYCGQDRDVPDTKSGVAKKTKAPRKRGLTGAY